MEDKAELRIYMKDLPCYEKTKEKPSAAIKSVGNRCFDLGKIPTEGLRADIRPFLLHRSTILTLSSMKEEIRQYNVFCRFKNILFEIFKIFLNPLLKCFVIYSRCV